MYASLHEAHEIYQPKRNKKLHTLTNTQKITKVNYLYSCCDNVFTNFFTKNSDVIRFINVARSVQSVTLMQQSTFTVYVC